jgi:hypothetical protein
MVKTMYTLKVILLQKQLEMTDLKRMRRVTYFVSLIYVCFWHGAVVSLWAPKNDLDIIQLLNCCPNRHAKEIALKMAKRYLWYLSESNVGLTFLDERITVAEKGMFHNLEKPKGKRNKMIRWRK